MKKKKKTFFHKLIIFNGATYFRKQAQYVNYTFPFIKSFIPSIFKDYHNDILFPTNLNSNKLERYIRIRIS